MSTQSIEFFAVIIERTIRIPGDERSRTHPGHGSPAHTTEHQEFIEFKNEEAFRAWIEREEKKTHSKERYKAIRFKPVTIKTNISYE